MKKNPMGGENTILEYSFRPHLILFVPILVHRRLSSPLSLFLSPPLSLSVSTILFCSSQLETPNGPNPTTQTIHSSKTLISHTAS